MKKTILIMSVVAVVVIISAFAAIALAQKATLINTDGDKVVVDSGSKQAQDYFNKGYVLMGSKFGSVVGPDVYFDMNIHGSLVDGGVVTNASTTLTINDTLTAAEVCGSNVITVNSAASTTLGNADTAAAGLTVTLPTAAQLNTTCLGDNGAHLKFLFANLSPTAASTTVITAGTGIDLLSDDANGDIIAGGGRAIVDCWHVENWYINQSAVTTNDAMCTISPYTAAD